MLNYNLITPVYILFTHKFYAKKLTSLKKNYALLILIENPQSKLLNLSDISCYDYEKISPPSYYSRLSICFL